MKDLTELPSGYASSKSEYEVRGLLQLTGWKYTYKPFEAYCKSLGNDIERFSGYQKSLNSYYLKLCHAKREEFKGLNEKVFCTVLPR